MRRRNCSTYSSWLVLAFGQDEEIGGHFGAAFVNQHLLSLYGADGIAMIVDEGGSGVDDTQFGRTFALPGVVEKGSTVSPLLSRNDLSD